MRVADVIHCDAVMCDDVVHDSFAVSDLDIDPEAIRIIMVSEAPPPDGSDWFYAPGTPSYLESTIDALRNAGVAVSSMEDILDRGIYVTTAVKCAKTAYAVKAASIERCADLLEEELALFPNVAAILLMGDVAIKAMNAIAKKRTRQRAFPAGPIFRIRGGRYELDGVRLLPSYLQTGKSYEIEPSKREMIAEDIRAALEVAGGQGGRSET